MPQKRRKYDITDSHHLAEWAHERLDKVEPLLDKLNRNVWTASGALAVIMLLLTHPDLLKVFQPEVARAAVVHAPR